MARIGSVLYLMALPLHSMLGWSIPVIIVVSRLCVVIYSVLGGITAVIWTDAIQRPRLIARSTGLRIGFIVSMPEGLHNCFYCDGNIK